MGTPVKEPILRQDLTEQKQLWDSSPTRHGMAQLLVHGRDVAMQDPQARPKILNQDLHEQGLMWADSTISRRMTMFAVDGRRAATKKPATAKSMLQQNLNEQRAALTVPDVATGMSAVSLRLTQHALTDSQQAKTLRHTTMTVMEGISKDPTEKPRLLALMSSLMEDPSMKAKLLAMMKSMMASGPSGSSGGGAASKASGSQHASASSPASGETGQSQGT